MNSTESPANVSASTRPLPRTAMIGVGSMGGAILAGLCAPGSPAPLPITVTTRSEVSASKYDGDENVVALASEVDPDANRTAVAGAGLVILAVKPWMIVEAAREIAGALEPGAIVVSVAAGVPSEAIESALPEAQVVRTMPNTPSHIGRGMTGIAGGTSASAEAIETVRRLFGTVGDTIVVDEGRINAVGAVSGSGPAYLFFFAEEMTAAAERLGFSRDEASALALGTITGAAELMRQSGDDPAQLRRKVTSPNGTTERSIDVLQAGGLGELLDRALAANMRRAEELAVG